MAVQEGLGGVDVNLTVKYFDVTNPEWGTLIYVPYAYMVFYGGLGFIIDSRKAKRR
jgi:hypothetical protein